jgi:PAS domain S-box-containing protein
MNILVVDDNECNRYQLDVLLSGNGYHVTTAAHGAEALDKARQSPPDLVIADILMPVMDGFSLCREWKKDEHLRRIPFVFYTATYTDERDRELALSLGADQFILKPEEPDIFVRRIWEVIHQAEHGARASAAKKLAEPIPFAVPEPKEADYLRQYNQVLIHKLEDKLVQLEQARRDLEREVIAGRDSEEQLRRSEGQLELALDAAELGIWDWNLRTGYIAWSENHAELFGLPEDEVEGTYADFERCVHREDRAGIASAVAIARERHSLYRQEFRVVWPNGSVHWLASRGRFIYDSAGEPMRMIGVVGNIDERKRTEEALLIKDHAVASAISGVAMADLDGNLTYVNPSFLRLWGYKEEEEVLNHPLASFFQSPDQAATVLQILRESGAYVGEMVARRRDGTFFQVEVATTLVKDRLGASICLMGSFLDISERKQAEAERHRLELQVQQAQKLESLGLLAGGIAHDFNNLLTAILAQADLALTDLPAQAPGRTRLVEIVSASQRAADLCRQLLAYSGRVQLAIEPVDLSGLVEGLLPLLKISISKKVRLNCQLGQDMPTVEGDPTQLRQVIMNLVINASEAIGEGEGLVTMSTGVHHCDLTYLCGLPGAATAAPGRYVYLEVADTGCGMEPETQARIFDPFFTTKFTGRGLGLAAVLGIVQSHSGVIKVQSTLGKGATFKVLFPASTKAPKPDEPLPSSAEEWRGQGTVLLVDDEEPVRDVAAAMMQRLGFRVLAAVDGRQAIDLFRQSADQITCVLLDLTMPQMGGEEVAHELRQLRPDVRILLSSGYSVHEIARRFANANEAVAGYISKPYRIAELRAALVRLLSG